MLNPSAFTLVYFVVVTVPLTVITLWIGIALQERRFPQKTFTQRLSWPFMWIRDHFQVGRNSKSRARRGRDHEAGNDISVFNEG